MWRVIQARRRGRAAARLHVRIVALFSVIAAAARHPGRGGRERHARSRSRPPVLAADPFDDRKLADRRGCLCARARAVRARRRHRDRHRAGAREAAVRSVARPVPQVPGRAGVDPRTAGGHAARQGSQRHRAGRFTGQPASSASRRPTSSPRSTIPSRRSAMFLDANYVAAIIKLRGYTDTYLYIARLLDPRVVAQLHATREGVAQYADLEVAPGRRADRLWPDVHRDRADRAAVGGLDRAQFRELPGRADPPPDRRRPGRRDRQSLRSGADPARRRAISPSSARPSTR